MSEPLYCFHLNEATGQLRKYEIQDYVIRWCGYVVKHKCYSFMLALNEKSPYKYNIKTNNLDRYVGQKLFTQNPDIDNAINIIISTLEKKSLAAKKEHQRCERIIKRIKKVNTGQLPRT